MIQERDTSQQSYLVNRYLETIKIFRTQVYNLEYHQKRVNKTIGEGKLELVSIISSFPEELTRCRIVYDDNGNYNIEYIPYKKRKVKRLKLLFDDSLRYEKKYEERTCLNVLFEQRDGCDDILIVQNGLITDTSIANIALFDGEHWFTPEKPLLEGTMRAKLIDQQKLFTRDIHYEELGRYKKLALLNAMIDFDIIMQDKIEDIIC